MFEFDNRPCYVCIGSEVLLGLFEKDWVVKSKGCLHISCKFEDEESNVAMCASHAHDLQWHVRPTHRKVDWCVGGLLMAKLFQQ